MGNPCFHGHFGNDLINNLKNTIDIFLFQNSRGIRFSQFLPQLFYNELNSSILIYYLIFSHKMTIIHQFALFKLFFLFNTLSSGQSMTQPIEKYCNLCLFSSQYGAILFFIFLRYVANLKIIDDPSANLS